MDDLKQKRFLWGIALALAPWVPIVIALPGAFRGLSNSKATGLAALAAGLAEIFVECGIGAIIIGQTVAFVLLFRAFAPGHGIRSLVSVLSGCLSALMLLLVGFFLWAVWFLPATHSELLSRRHSIY